MAVGDYKGNGMRRVVAYEYEGTSMGVLLACVRDGGMSNNNINVCARKGEGVRMVTSGVQK